MRYIITGATGHIGNNIARKLIDENKEVVLLVRRIDNSIKDLNAMFIKGDVFNYDFLCDNINEGDVVIHLAGVIDIKNNKKEETIKINYEGTKTIYNASLYKKVKRFIYFSTTDCIPFIEDEEIFEPKDIDPNLLVDNYSHSKALATKYIMDQRQINPNMMVNIMYPSAVIGVNDYKPSSIGKVVLDIINNKMQFGIKGGYNFVDVDDIALAVSKLLNINNNEDYLLTGSYISIYNFYNVVNEVLNRKKHTLKIPTFLVYPFIPFIPYLSKFVIKTINQNPNFNNHKFINLLNQKTTDFKETVNKTVNFFKQNKGDK